MRETGAMALAYPDPAGSSAIGAAMAWLQATFLGSVATSIAIIAVAAIGFRMLTGRVHWRYGASVLVGCFILFGASAIAAGLRAAMEGREAPVVVAPPPVVPPRAVALPAAPPANADPFAGAAVPAR
jgi:type IV secretory pathway VirB2 component (pilin)